jgi:hypothetical protein
MIIWMHKFPSIYNKIVLTLKVTLVHLISTYRWVVFQAKLNIFWQEITELAVAENPSL